MYSQMMVLEMIFRGLCKDPHVPRFGSILDNKARELRITFVETQESFVIKAEQTL